MASAGRNAIVHSAEEEVRAVAFLAFANVTQERLIFAEELDNFARKRLVLIGFGRLALGR